IRRQRRQCRSSSRRCIGYCVKRIGINHCRSMYPWSMRQLIPIPRRIAPNHGDTFTGRSAIDRPINLARPGLARGNGSGLWTLGRLDKDGRCRCNRYAHYNRGNARPWCGRDWDAQDNGWQRECTADDNNRCQSRYKRRQHRRDNRLLRLYQKGSNPAILGKLIPTAITVAAKHIDTFPSLGVADNRELSAGPGPHIGVSQYRADHRKDDTLYRRLLQWRSADKGKQPQRDQDWEKNKQAPSKY